MRIVLVHVVLLSCACGTSLTFARTQTSPHKLQPRAAEQVQVFMVDRPTRPYVEIGMVEALNEYQTYNEDRAMSRLIKNMREYAGELGCDALVILGGNDSTVSPLGAFGNSPGRYKGYRGSCLVYVNRSAASLPAVSAAATTCVPNSTQLCYGPGGCRGGQSCTAEGHSYTPCDCRTSQATAPTP